MGSITRFFAMAGLLAGVGLSVFDFITSMMGIRQIMGSNTENLIVFLMPFFFATLALCFNGVSAHIFRMYMKEGFGSFASSVTFCMWVFFLSYDGISSFIGMLSSYSGRQIGSLDAAFSAYESLGSLAGFFVIIMSVLLSFGPFLCAVFSDLGKTAVRASE